MQWNLMVCEVVQAWPVWLGVIATMALGLVAWPILSTSRTARTVAMFVVITSVSLISAKPAYAIVPPPGGGNNICGYLEAIGAPCWMKEAFWCPCSPPPPDAG